MPRRHAHGLTASGYKSKTCSGKYHVSDRPTSVHAAAHHNDEGT
jgi:hypothetical protein